MGDKRDLAVQFRERLETLIQKAGGNRSAFARTIGIDRSALSQILAAGATRLPRAETLTAIAEAANVTVDWLVGLEQSPDRSEVTAETAILERDIGSTQTRLAEWHREAQGYKIRYVPATLPDFMRTDALIAHENLRRVSVAEDTIREDAADRLDYNRRPETEMEVCIPKQTLEMLADGHGIWAGLDGPTRRAQLEQMASLTRELYPTFRMFAIDAQRGFSAPYTVFGPLRVAVYLGGIYAIFTRTSDIRSFIGHFDDLIRRAVINPNEAADWLDRLAARVKD